MRKQADTLLTTLVLAVLLLIAVAWSFAPVVEAAPTKPTSACDEVATTGSITTWQCVDLDGHPFLQNSYGFMAYQP